jgi:hypothetical protein
MVTMPGARKSHSTGVYLLRFGTKVGAPTGAQTKHQGNVLIDTAITTTFKERLDVPLYSADERVVNAASECGTCVKLTS